MGNARPDHWPPPKSPFKTEQRPEEQLAQCRRLLASRLAITDEQATAIVAGLRMPIIAMILENVDSRPTFSEYMGSAWNR